MSEATQPGQHEIEDLRARLAEMEQTLEAIHEGQVDAVVVEDRRGPRVYTLETPDLPYRELVEQMSEGAASISQNGILLFCNKRLAQMVDQPLESLVGSPVCTLVAGSKRSAFVRLLDHCLAGEAKGEMQFEKPDGTLMPVHVSLRGIETDQGSSICMVATDLSELKEAASEIKHQADRHDALISTTADGYWHCDLEGKLLDVNETYCAMSGYSRQELMRMSREELEGLGILQSLHEEIKRMHGGQFVRFETQSHKKDGSIFYAEISASYLPATSELLIFVRDVSGRKLAEAERDRAEEKLRHLNEKLEDRISARTKELQDLNQELESFNYAIAHDLRVPLRHIDAYTNMLMEEAGPVLGESATDLIQKLHRTTDFMAHLLEDLLSLARLGRQKIQTQTCGLDKIVEEVVKELEPESRDHVVEWRIQKLPFVDCDPALMKTVVSNLLSNAVKFSKFRRPAIIEVGCEQRDAEIVVFVRDNGVGFSMQYADKLFGIFQRLHRQEDFSGTGVGLAIVQRLIQRHGGRVWAEAELNKGAKFYFSLPVSGADIDKDSTVPQHSETIRADCLLQR